MRKCVSRAVAQKLITKPRFYIVACVYYLATAVSVAQPLMHGANSPQYQTEYFVYLSLLPEVWPGLRIYARPFAVGELPETGADYILGVV
jgi:hypothetical protein